MIANRAITNDLSHYNFQSALHNRSTSHLTLAASNPRPASTLKQSHALAASISRPSTPVLGPVDRRPSWRELDLQYQAIESLPDRLRVKSLERIIADERAILCNTATARPTALDVYHRKCRVNSMAWTAHVLGGLREREGYRRPFPEVSVEAVQVQEPPIFTARDTIALERLQSRVKKARHDERNDNFDRSDRFRANREVRMLRELEIKRRNSVECS